MNPKLELDGHIYMLTVGSVLTTNVFQTNLCQLLICSELYSQRQARLTFVTTLGMDIFDCTKMNAHSQLVYGRGSFMSVSRHY